MRKTTAQCLFSLAILTASATRASGQAVIAVEPPIQVSRVHSSFIHDEVIVAADPSHPNRLLACSIVHKLGGTRTVTNVAYISNDSGHSWTEALVFADVLEAYDPSCAYGPDGEAYVAGIERISFETFKTKVVVYRSEDGGRQWKKSEVGNPGENDRPFVTVDSSAGESRGAVYVVETARVSTVAENARALSVYRSTDHGNTFVQLSNITASKPSIPGGIVRPDGTLVTTVQQWSPSRTEILKLVRTDTTLQPDGKILLLEVGFAGSRLQKIADTYSCALERSGSPMHYFAADTESKAFHGRLYVTWPDSRSGRCEILFSYSADNGKTWSAPFAVNDDRPHLNGLGPDDCRPAVAVSPSGVVGVLWYDRRDSEDDRGWTARFAASLDGGETFQPSVALSPGQTHLMRGLVVPLTGMTSGGGSETSRGENMSALLGYESSHGLDAGDTSGLAAGADGVFHPVWVDNSTGIFQLWTAAVRITGAVVKNGVVGLANLDDVSSHVTALFDSVQLDKKRRLIIADVSILNTSENSLNGPFKLRILRALSPGGLLKVVNADETEGYTAVLNLSNLVPKGKLEPNQQSEPKHIEIALPGNDPLESVFAVDRLLGSGDGSYKTGFVRLDMKLFAQIGSLAAPTPKTGSQ